VQPQDIASNVIRANVPVQSVPTPLPNVIAPTEAGKADLNVSTETSITTSIPPNVSYVTKPRAESWAVGIVTKGTTTGKLPTTAAQKTQSISGSSMGTCATISYKERS
jgi:hypothetical protein